jgi:peptidoglycan lytic transglycosylase
MGRSAKFSRLLKRLQCLALLSLFLSPGVLSSSVLSTDRQQYGDAMTAIDRGRWTEYQQLRPSLEDYPLAVYLDYYSLSLQAHKVRPEDALRFLQSSADTPLRNRFLGTYLRQAGKDRRWQDFLQVMPEEPNSIDLKCYYFRAKLSSGDKTAAWEGAQRLWVYGESRPDQCDPLFDAWMRSGELTDDIVWARMLKAFDARQRSLMEYVGRRGSSELKPWADKLVAVYRKPDQIGKVSLPSKSPYSTDIASHGIAYLARYSPEKALQNWQAYQSRLDFSPDQITQAEQAISLHSLFAKTEAHKGWLSGALARLQEDRLVEIRLRWALAEQDWSAVTAHLPLLSAEQQQESAWRYWHAVSLQNNRQHDEAMPILQELATERGYYSFLAADQLQQAYSLNHQPLVLKSAASPALIQLPGVQRITELYFHEEAALAHSEWYKILQDSEQPDEQQQLASLASEQGWHRMAIDAANKAKAWDALDLRFPIAYEDTFDRNASLQQVPSTELMAIARRESAFFPEARSPVGARGLMQIMPATGKQVASSIGKRHSNSDLYQVEHNVQLGSAYYRQLLDRFDGNRVFALTAYNAGPHRVDRWRKASDKTLAVELWIETIPYKETRNYVQAVLAYNVVFQYLKGNPHKLLTEKERAVRY